MYRKAHVNARRTDGLQPRIFISGKQLQDAGFEVGDKVTVSRTGYGRLDVQKTGEYREPRTASWKRRYTITEHEGHPAIDMRGDHLRIKGFHIGQELQYMMFSNRPHMVIQRKILG